MNTAAAAGRAAAAAAAAAAKATAAAAAAAQVPPAVQTGTVPHAGAFVVVFQQAAAGATTANKAPIYCRCNPSRNIKIRDYLVIFFFLVSKFLVCQFLSFKLLFCVLPSEIWLVLLFRCRRWVVV